MRTSKSKFKAAMVYALREHQLLYPLLEQAPHEERTALS